MLVALVDPDTLLAGAELVEELPKTFCFWLVTEGASDLGAELEGLYGNFRPTLNDKSLLKMKLTLL